MGTLLKNTRHVNSMVHLTFRETPHKNHFARSENWLERSTNGIMILEKTHTRKIHWYKSSQIDSTCRSRRGDQRRTLRGQVTDMMRPFGKQVYDRLAKLCFGATCSMTSGRSFQALKRSHACALPTQRNRSTGLTVSRGSNSRFNLH